MDTEFSVEEVFNSAVSIVKNLPKEGSIKPSDSDKLKFYAFFKQATYGPNDTPKPRFYQLVEYYKWDAWQKLGDMPREEAMFNYIRELKQAMETIPKDETAPEESKHFEDVLGKKFYDYWFGQWQSDGQEITQQRRDDINNDPTTTSRHDSSSRSGQTRANDAQSDSSGGSSVSLLEDTQSPGGDGYKTPTTLEQTIADRQMSDQFAAAVLRLQQGLDSTVVRLSRVESQLQQSMNSIRLLENQTHAKQPISGYNNRPSQSRHPVKRFCNILSQIGTVHWFYLSYPIVVCLIIKAIENRKSRHHHH